MLFCYIAYGSYIDCVSYIALRQLYLPTASDIALFARSCGESGFLSFRHFVPPPSSDGGFFGGSKPTALHLSYIDCVNYIALQ